MRKRTVRAIAGLLAAMFIIVSMDISVFADEESGAANESSTEAGAETTGSGETRKENEEESGQENGDSEESKTETSEEASGEESGQSEEETETSTAEPEMIEADMGAVEVELTAGIRVEAEQTFQVLLKGKEGTERGELTLAPQEKEAASTDKIRFSALAEGSYQLMVAGDGYITYIQDLEIKKLGCRISLYTGRTEGFSDDARPGLLVYGDVNEDGQLNEADSAAIVEAMEAGAEGGSCDLNKDGKVDLLDLNYFTEFSENYQWQQATVETFVPSESVVSDTLKDTVVQEGSLENVINGEGKVTLATASGEAVSEENPLGVELDFSRTVRTVTVEEIRLASPQNDEGIGSGAVDVTYVRNGRTQTKRFSVDRTADGGLRAELGGKLDVRKMVLWITGARGEGGSQAELTGIDLIGDKNSRVSEPELTVPNGISVTPGGSFFTVSWERGINVTGYEVTVSSGDAAQTYGTGGNRLEISQINGEELEENGTYEVQVRGVNGAWKSAYSQPVSIVMKTGCVPDAPAYVRASAGVGSLTVEWETGADADAYNVYYKAEADEGYEKIEGINDTLYVISDLEPDTRYQVYVTAVNGRGESGSSLTAADRTDVVGDGDSLPEYNLINLSEGEGELSRHIRSVQIGEGAVMTDSPLDQEGGSGLGLFDNSAASCMKAEGRQFGLSGSGEEEGVTVQLDQVYEVGMIAFAQPWNEGTYADASVWYWDGQNQRHEAEHVTMVEQKGGEGTYYLIQMDGVRTSKLQIGVGRGEDGPDHVSISEIRLYAYDSIGKEIGELFADDLHTELQEDVEEEDIEALEQRLDREDAVSGEQFPRRTALKRELQEARNILDGRQPGGITEINPSISVEKDRELEQEGLVDWQPLGVTGLAGQEVAVYVAHSDLDKGETADLELVIVQHHGEQENYYDIRPLAAGKNEIVIPDISSLDKEKGGALYIRYTGDDEKDDYRVRVSGGRQYPVLNLYRVPDEEREDRIRSYVGELGSYVAALEDSHREAHGREENETAGYDYDETECIFNVTDIVTDHMMISVPASQVLDGLGNSGQEQRLSDMTAGMDEMMELFYGQKGLAASFEAGTDQAVAEKNHLPYQYLQIRYMEIPDGAFLYAAENHIGIGWNETAGLMTGGTLTADQQGRYESGRYFGWAVTHEIGHQVGGFLGGEDESTANYFALLAQAEENDGVNLDYDQVFRRVASGIDAGSEDPLIRSAMYWQLHLAYDRGYPYKSYRNYQELCDNMFFARVGSYARDPASAPTGIALELSGDRDQAFMRLASSAAQRDLTLFFERWGMRPDEETKSYMSQYAPEERAIYYLDDAAKAYDLERGGAGDSVAGRDGLSVQAESAANGAVTLTVGFETGGTEHFGADGLLQGYEITRVFTEGGEERREPAGFTRDGVFMDSLSGMSGRTVIYEATAIDKFMNRSTACRTETLKPEGDGRLSQCFWKAETNMISTADYKTVADRNHPCKGSLISAAGQTIDGRGDTTFTGKAENEDPYIILKLGRHMPVSALRYTLTDGVGAVTDYRIEISEDGDQYVQAAEGSFDMEEGADTVYFERDGQEVIFDAAYVKLTAVGQKGAELSFTELELYGPAGDNVGFQAEAEGGLTAGILSEAYVYGSNPEDRVPAGATVVIGNWRGRNPAGGNVVLYDEKGGIVGGTQEDGSPKARQTIIVPQSQQDGKEAEGIWLYWLEPENKSASPSLPGKVRAELYREEPAAGEESDDEPRQWTVSDTLFVELPRELPTVKLEN